MKHLITNTITEMGGCQAVAIYSLKGLITVEDNRLQNNAHLLALHCKMP